MSRSWWAVVAALILPMSLMGGASAHADEGGPRERIVQGGAPPAMSQPEVARGVIVRTTGTAALLGARAAVEGLPLDVAVVGSRSIGVSTDVLLFDRLVPVAEAEAAADAIASRTGVVWAEPDKRVSRTATPVIPNDTFFNDMKQLWNGGGSSDYSIKAPLVWGRQVGKSSVVVAILDTGITRHPDLDANVVSGYDFISDVRMANDGNGWDPDPADAGDWITEAESVSGFFEGCDPSPSSWHGTHVAGTVGAVQDNNFGITGVAPGARLQTVRVLGKCGGFNSDVAAGITWASGGSVPGVPPNPTPAKVLNMSLGSNGTCAPDSALGSAISGAISRGSTVVVAVSNENEPATQKSPANCAGTIRVTAVDVRGQRAGYANYGVAPGEVTIAAPGGDFDVTGDGGVLSTYNAGTTVPVYPSDGLSDFSFLQGTSMATPHVAGAAALLYSAGVTSPTRVRELLVAAVQPFPVYGNSTWDCTTLRCGAGILDLSRLQVDVQVAPPGAPTGLTVTPVSDTRVTLRWSAPSDNGGGEITSYELQYSRNSAAYQSLGPTPTSETARDVTNLAPGSTYTFRVAAINSAGTGAFSEPSPAYTVPGTQVTVPGKVSGFSLDRFTKTGATFRVTARWKAPTVTGGAAVTGYVARVGVGGRWSAWGELTEPATLLTKLRKGTRYQLQVRAVNSAGEGATAAYSFTTPRR